MQSIFLLVSAIINLMLAFALLIRTNSAMALIAYLVKRGYPLPSNEEFETLCREAWKHMFTREK